jgi:poly(3-hydroxybutyrate) depolymerase
MRGCVIAALAAGGLMSLAACGGGADAVAGDAAAPPTTQELQCQAQGWQRRVVPAGGLSRLVLWKTPPAGWTGGAIVVLHGGGGQHTNFCVANVALIAPQVRFTDAALAQGYAVFLLDSSDRITDEAGRLCGKVWDDEVRTRANLDLPFVEEVLRTLIPSLRPAGSRGDVYLTGLSSGGYMATRAATRFGEWITAFAPVSSGDPYGWFRDCSPRATDRPNVFGAAFDSETRRQIVEPGACDAPAYPNEKPWDGAPGARRAPFRVFHHAQDGIHDRSCVEKLRRQLLAHGHAETAPLTLDGGARRAEVHYWLDAYNAELLAFFAAQRR